MTLRFFVVLAVGIAVLPACPADPGVDAGATGGGGGSVQTGGGSAQTGGGSTQTGGGSAGTGGGSAGTGGGSGQTGGGSAQTGGGSAQTGGGSAQTGGGSAQTGGGSAQTGGGSSGTGGGSAVPKALGELCAGASECQSGFCADGVCCNSACTSTCHTCSGVMSTDVAGRCAPISAGADPENECSLNVPMCESGMCDGTGACAKASNGTVCRPPSTSCDRAETCNAGVCPVDGVADAGTVCRAAVGFCDVDDVCDGVAAACPVDALKTAGTSCRSSQGACDPIEFCTGSSPNCPADLYLAGGTPCRPSVGICDVAETCTGSAAACPLDDFAAQGTPCRGDAGLCDLASVCTGTSNACPANVLLSGVCRPSVGECDVAESCTGTSGDCPVDSMKPNTAVCGTYAGYRCSGTTSACPTSCTSNTQCNSDAGANNTCRDGKRCMNGKWAFTTSGTFSGNLGGLDGGDRICGNLARDAGLTGNYRAWIADSTGSPATRFTQSNVPWFMPNGARLVTGWTDLMDGTIGAQFRITETGATVPSSLPRTNVRPYGLDGGSASGTANCLNYTSNVFSDIGAHGDSSQTGYRWSEDSSRGCSDLARLYCFEQ